MRKIVYLALLSSLILGTSCNAFKEEFVPESAEEKERLMMEQEKREKEASINKRLKVVGDLIEDGDLDDAEEMLGPLEKYEYARDQISVLRKRIAIGREKQPKHSVSKMGEEKMLDEIDERMGVPSTFGQTIVIDSDLSPLELPMGKMEDLINRKVTMHLENATVGMLVDFLNDNGLNVIADDALASDKTLTMKVTDVPLKEVFSYVARNMGIAFYIGENMVWITESDDKGGPKLETRILRLPNGFVPETPAGGSNAPGAETGGIGNVPTVEDTELEDAMTAFLQNSPAGSSFQIFRTRNILVIRNTRENIRFVEEMIREFDRPPMQVVIEARFITISQSDLREVGVEIAQQGSYGYTEADRTTGTKGKENNLMTTLGDVASDVGYGQLTISGVIGKRIFDTTIKAMESKESAVSLSVPRLTVMNNRSARIREGDKLFYFEEYDLESVDNGDRGTEERLVPSGSPTELTYGMTFDVNVNVGNNGKTVMLGLKPQLVQFIKWEDFLTSGDDDDDDDSESGETTTIKLPHMYEQSVVTSVNVQSGETVVLGGMLKKSKKRAVVKVPFLGDLPVLGWLFRKVSTSEEPTNLLIFVTATVVNERGEYQKTLSADEVLPANKK